MTNNARPIAALAVMMMLGTAGVAGANASDTTIVLRVHNQCGLERASLVRAGGIATRIYDRIGIRLIWSDVAPGPSEGTLRLRVVLGSKSAEKRLTGGTDLPKTVLGLAPLRTSTVYLFCERIAYAAGTAAGEFQMFLARALGHEIGHHLLPDMTHSETGIMRANLDHGVTDPPGFTDAQGESIRTFLRRRGRTAAP